MILLLESQWSECTKQWNIANMHCVAEFQMLFDEKLYWSQPCLIIIVLIKCGCVADMMHMLLESTKCYKCPLLLDKSDTAFVSLCKC